MSDPVGLGMIALSLVRIAQTIRKGAAIANDNLVIGPNDRVGVIGPNDIPAPTSLTKGGGLAGIGVTGL